jgi:uncharacterized protein
MRKLIVVCGLAGLLAAAAIATAARATPAAAITTPPNISVTGEGSVHGPPDTARVRLGVEVFGPMLAPADTEADQRMSAIVRGLRSASVPEAHIRTVGLMISPQYDLREGQPTVLLGYLVRNLLEVETSDIGGLGALIDGAIAAGANRVEDIRFESQNLSQLQSQARDLAWQSARVKADQLARRAGVSLVQVTLIEEPFLETTPAVRAEGPAGQAGNVLAPPSPTQPGEIEVRAQVHIVWSTE